MPGAPGGSRPSSEPVYPAEGFHHALRGRPSAGFFSLKAFLVLALLGAAWMPAGAQLRVVGYYPSWERSSLPASAVLFKHLTHINLAFAWPLANGTITGYADLLYPELVTAAHAAGRKVLISMGGWGQSAGFAPMAADSTVRAAFVANLVKYIQTNGFDGVDLDWEFPLNAGERTNLTRLIRDTRQAFAAVNPTWLITMAVPQSNWNGQWLDFGAMNQYVDWYNVMTYDTHGSWSNHAGHNCPLYAPTTDVDGSVQQALQYMRGSRGVPASKMTLGIPFYGKEFTADSLYKTSTACIDVRYREIPSRIGNGWTYRWDNLSKVPFLTRTPVGRTLSFDDSLSVTLKCQYAKDNSLAGVMIWALGQDVIGTRQPLVEAIGKATGSSTGLEEIAASGLPGRPGLLAPYPNPFNPATRIPFVLTAPAEVSLTIVDLLGRQLAELAGGRFSAGRHEVVWNAQAMASGFYFARLTVTDETGRVQYTRAARLILMR